MKTILWDWNGTLLDDIDCCIACVNVLLRKHALPSLDSVDAYREKFRFPIEDYYRACGFDFTKTPFDELAREYIALYQPASAFCALVPGALQALDAARAQGCRQIVLSASQKDNLLDQMRAYPLEGYFAEVLGIGDVFARSKVELAKRWREKPENRNAEVIVIGDSFHDFEVATAIGARCVLFAGGHQLVTDDWKTRCSVARTLPEAVALLG